MISKMSLRPLLRGYRVWKKAPKTFHLLGTFVMLSLISSLSPAWPMFNLYLSPYLNLPILEEFSKASMLEILRFSYVLANHPTLLEQINLITLFILVGHLVYMIAMFKGTRVLFARLDRYTTNGHVA